jgi:hypothetical protein
VNIQKEAYVRVKVVSSVVRGSEIQAQLGVDCDQVWNAGDQTKAGRSTYKHSGVIITSGCDVLTALEIQLQEVLNKVEKLPIENLPDSCRVEVSIVYYGSRSPALYFELETLERITRLRAALDIDLYISDVYTE